jgi:uncharacterized protein
LALTATAGERIVTLDVVRGVAVMGILAMNVVAFAMPFQAYMNPAAFGSEGAADYAAWALNFLLIDGKMRGLFSFLFGASMLLVIERAAAGGRDPGSVHFRRMAWLLVFGLLHFAFIWFGDILAGYALVGMIAYLFHRLTPRALVAWGVGLLVVQTLVFGAFALAALALQYAAADPGAASELAASWSQMQAQYGVPGQQALAADLALHHGGYLPLFLHRIDRLTEPFAGVLFFGWETLAYFLFGMALLKSGFFHGIWSRRQYVRVLLVGYGVGVPVMATIAYFFYQSGFSVPAMFGLALGATTPVRPLMILATASLIILLTSRGGKMVDRIAATGRAAFTNYIATSVLMTTFFYGYGFGLYGSLGRAELWVVVIATWALMLLWSKPWLQRYRYGPLEWVWRSLARSRAEPMRI